MKSIITMLLLLLSTALLQPASAQNLFTANLSGNNETHLVTTMGSGMIDAELNGQTLTVTGSFMNLSSPVATEIAGGAHIHMGLAGQNGPVSLVLNATLDADKKGGTFEASNNTFTLTQDQAMALSKRMLYVNIHTDMYNAGELRGQLVP